MGDNTVSTARSNSTLPSKRRPRAGQATAGAEVKGRLKRYRPRAVAASLPSWLRPTATTWPSLALARNRARIRSGRGDLIAYAIKRRPLTADHGAPFRLINPTGCTVTYRKSELTTILADSGEFQTATTSTSGPTHPARARRPDTRARSRPGPGARRGRPPRHLHRARKGLTGQAGLAAPSTSASRGKASGRPAKLEPRRTRRSGRTGARLGGDPASAGAACALAQPTPPATSEPNMPPWNGLGYGNDAVGGLRGCGVTRWVHPGRMRLVSAPSDPRLRRLDFEVEVRRGDSSQCQQLCPRQKTDRMLAALQAQAGSVNKWTHHRAPASLDPARR